MSNDQSLRQEIRHSLKNIRALIRNYSGLYSSEDLTREVLCACDALGISGGSGPRLEQAKRMIEERCNRLAQATDRFSGRDPALIASSRAQAVASIDLLQDALLELRRIHHPDPSIRGLLRRKSL